MDEPIIPIEGSIILFGGNDTTRYVMTQGRINEAKKVIVDAIKSGLPVEARRADVLCYLFDEMKVWAKSQTLNL